MQTERLYFNDYGDHERVRFIATPQESADAWAASSGSAQAKWDARLQATTKDIVGRAIAAKSSMAANFAARVNDGTWENNLSRVGNAGIKAAAHAKAQNYGTGVGAAKPKYLAAAQKVLPAIAQAVAIVESMPTGNIGASKARVNAYMDYLHGLKGTLGA